LYLADSTSVAQTYKRPLASEFFYRDLNDALPASLKGKAPDWTDALLSGKTVDDLAATLKRPWEKSLLQQSKSKIEAVIESHRLQGNLYKVDLPDPMIAKMLDWDKPLSQQPSQVMDVIREKLKGQNYLGPNDNGPRQLQAALKAWKMEHGGMAESTMESLVGGRGNLLGETPEEVAQNLKKVGIPGIKYLDQGSRGAGAGTHNYVVFPGEEQKLNILERNGKALADALRKSP
jgi:hypothetical protein